MRGKKTKRGEINEEMMSNKERQESEKRERQEEDRDEGEEK